MQVGQWPAQRVPELRAEPTGRDVSAVRSRHRAAEQHELGAAVLERDAHARPALALVHVVALDSPVHWCVTNLQCTAHFFAHSRNYVH